MPLKPKSARATLHDIAREMRRLNYANSMSAWEVIGRIKAQLEAAGIAVPEVPAAGQGT